MDTVLQNFDIQKINQLKSDESGLAYPTIESENLLVTGLDSDIIEIGKVWFPWHYTFVQTKPKLWGLFKGIKIDEEDIEEAKKTLFPDRF